MNNTHVIKDAIHDNIKLSDFECALLDTEEMQKLRGIKQLAVAYLVYPGANHTRFEHSLGTMHLTGEFCESFGLGKEETSLLRAAALLHDVGHVAFSHDGETVAKNAFKLDHEKLGEEKIKNSKLADIISANGFSPSEIISLLRGKGNGQLITSEIGADRMDYLLRDSHYTGVAYGVIDYTRLIETAKMHKGKLLIEAGGLTSVESLLIGRFLMFSAVYLQHAVRIASSMLHKALIYGLEERALSREQFLALDDSSLLRALESGRKSKALSLRLQKRILYKRAFELSWVSLNKRGKELLSSPRGLAELESEFVKEAGIPPEEIALSFYPILPPPAEAKLSVLIDEREVPLDEISELTKSIEKAEEKRARLIVAAPKEKLKQVSSSAEKIFRKLVV
ncbi:MAG: HD domain-containing protein [Candidatus Micrarchaeota archaeon]